MNEELKRILDIQDKKWQVIYSFTDSGSSFISQPQYETLLEAVKEANTTGRVQKIILKDGRILATDFKMVVLNPEWRDPVESKGKEMFYRLQKDFNERRNMGDDITWEDYLAERKKNNKKELDDFMQRLNK